MQPDGALNRRDFLKTVGAATLSTLVPGASPGLSGADDGERKTVRCAIYPGIGIARVGNSPDEFFIGPEVPGWTPEAQEGFTYKDQAGRIKRQAARFRIYGFDEHGRVTKELTLEDDGVVDIRWTVQVANKKAAWYAFHNAMDLPVDLAIAAGRRNKDVLGEQRKDLMIEPESRSIQGRNQSGAQYHLGGRFLSENVELGELRTDDHGRLLFLGGFGRSDTPLPANPVTNFSNNDGWFDDVSDGPVTALVSIRDGTGGVTTLQAEPAWVIVTPPKYAPGLTSLVTLYDVCWEVAVEAGWLPMPARLSFADHIFPLLQRLSRLQWVSSGHDLLHGWQAQLNFLEPEYLNRLADPGAAGETLRKQVFQAFRNPDYGQDEPDKLPLILGDGVDYPGNPRQWFVLLKTQYKMLQQWSEGNFDNQHWENTIRQKPLPFETIPLEEQPAALDRAALEPCLGGPFHPGVEVPWLLRHRQLYQGPFRLKHPGKEERGKDDYGPQLRPEICLAPDGPLSSNAPGNITRWMGVPWQSDAASCQDVYVPKDFPLPAWWPASLPINVLPAYAYRQLMDPDLPRGQREKFFGFRRKWARGVGDVGYHAEGGYTQAMIHMVHDWKDLGFIVRQNGPQDPHAEGFPADIYVETERGELRS